MLPLVDLISRGTMSSIEGLISLGELIQLEGSTHIEKLTEDAIIFVSAHKMEVSTPEGAPLPPFHGH